ncbi:MAG TPA: WecB/TagA/CpsF family glycosyltransferase [Acidimicrobiales bacterium]|nr:WecB/TagA/CpsF family glycosyltransferase [Acidimicrobiales bacterium]
MDTPTTSTTTERRRTRQRTVTLGGQRVDLISQPQLGGAIAAALEGRRKPLYLASANLDHVYRFEGQERLFEATDAGQWLVLLDGMPLVWACKRKTGRDWDRIAGSDYLPELLSLAEMRGSRVGFLGGSETLRAPLADAIAHRWPALFVTGHWTPPREVVEDPGASSEVASAIEAADTDILVVGLGKPRQEVWIARHAAETGAKVSCAFGASAEFVAGWQQRAPEAISKVGGEWLYRLAKDPRRLARRYLAEGPVALARVARDVVAAA